MMTPSAHILREGIGRGVRVCNTPCNTGKIIQDVFSLSFFSYFFDRDRDREEVSV